MPLNVMKSETLEEARERLMEQTRKEREGFEAVTEGQLTELSRRSASFVGEEHQDLIDEEHERRDELRMRGTMQDRPDEDSVEWTRQAVQNDPDSSIFGEDAGRRSARRGGSKSQGKGSEAKAAREAERAERKRARDAEKATRPADEGDGGQA